MRNYNDNVYAKWRKDIFTRDKFKCRMPNCKSRDNLQAHHIIKWSSAHSLRYELSNGITLCKRCHESIRGKENSYSDLFRSIIG